MTPHYTDDWLTIYGGDCREILASLPSDSVDCVVTSPPYWGLRDYGSDGQLGLERTPEEYVANMVAVFREVRRVLKPSGTCWLNLGDSYTSSGIQGPNSGLAALADRFAPRKNPRNPNRDDVGDVPRPSRSVPVGLKPKDLVGIPWRVAFALQADGWYLRSDIIWSKPNPMPESVTDRPTQSHEYLFLLTKSARYYFDADAVREAAIYEGVTVKASNPDQHDTVVAGRNIRSVWSIATRPYPGAHFAVFPPELPERCIKAGSSERGVCGICGAPFKRVVVRVTHFEGGSGKAGRTAEEVNATGKWAGKQYGKNIKLGPVNTIETTGWDRTCQHDTEPRPPVILDPFAGSGTVGMVANRLSRRAILIDLNPDYLRQQMKRNAQAPLGLGA